jgi:hypothetical protein
VSFDAGEVNVDFTTLVADEFHQLGETAGSECLMAGRHRLRERNYCAVTVTVAVALPWFTTAPDWLVICPCMVTW